MIPTPDELKYFFEVAENLNMSRASERLGISQPALTFAIQRIERTLGQKILIRNKSGVQLTRAGQKLQIYGRELLTFWERLKAETAKEENQIGGRYVIGCHPSVALYTLSTF